MSPHGPKNSRNEQPETPRTRRVADRVVEVLAEVFERRTEDPRLRQITVTGARVSRDLGMARVWITGGFPPADEPKVLAALKHATPRLRSLLAPELRLRIVPDLTFVIDHSSESGARIEELLRDIHAERAAEPEAEPPAEPGAEPPAEPRDPQED
jgi:ribosome-binding factor A